MFENLDCRDLNTYNQAIHYLEKIFHKQGHKLQKIKELALKIKNEIEKISPFIQQNTRTVCPNCKEVCCISKHGYYNYEDLVYFYALGLSLPAYEFGRNDSDPCQFLTENGCSLERQFRPSGCNWYFCDPLLDYMEKQSDYQEFDMAMTNLAELWLKLIEEFFLLTNSSHSELF
jgi:hypothetical protein